MWSYHPDLLATPVPRYTSYPTAAEFHDGVGAAEQVDGLGKVSGDEPFSLYIHIPYCREICWYCGCNTGAANRAQRLANYLDRLAQEIDLIATSLGGRGRVVRVAFGGGSPNAISPSQFLGLAQRLGDAFEISDEAVWSVELDPRGFDAGFADAMQRVGVSRASLGVQTFDEHIQQAIGRIQPLEAIERSVTLLRQAGVTSLNFDLMYGLPHQDETALEATLAKTVELGADRLAVFGYAHVPHLLPRQRRIDGDALPNAEQRFRQAELAHRTLASAGFTAIGFDHFARPDDPLAAAACSNSVRRNFQGFTDDPCDTLIGLGASSISRFAGALVQNERNSGRYGMLVDSGRLAGMRGIAASTEERRRGRIIERLLCQGYADLGALPELGSLKDALLPFAERGLVTWRGDWLHVSDDAIPYARAIASTLDPWRAESKTRFSSAV